MKKPKLKWKTKKEEERKTKREKCKFFEFLM